MGLARLSAALAGSEGPAPPDADDEPPTTAEAEVVAVVVAAEGLEGTEPPLAKATPPLEPTAAPPSLGPAAALEVDGEEKGRRR